VRFLGGRLRKKGKAFFGRNGVEVEITRAFTGTCLLVLAPWGGSVGVRADSGGRGQKRWLQQRDVWEGETSKSHFGRSQGGKAPAYAGVAGEGGGGNEGSEKKGRGTWIKSRLKYRRLAHSFKITLLKTAAPSK